MRYLTILFILLCGILIFVAKEAKSMKEAKDLAPYAIFSRDEWKKLGKEAQVPLKEKEINALHGQIEPVTLTEVEDIYLPLSQLLRLHYKTARQLNEESQRFLKRSQSTVPFVIGITGSVCVGKSTASRALKALLEKWDIKPNVQIVTTDGFLFPNKVLEKRGLMSRKGFPESFDSEALLRFLTELKSGKNEVKAPLYSHQVYDILPHNYQTLVKPDVVIIEGVNILQSDRDYNPNLPRIFVSDITDFTIYVDAEKEDVKGWFLERFMHFREKARYDDKDFYYQFSKMMDQEALAFASDIWDSINEVNLREYILPYRNRANLILVKGRDHRVKEVHLRH